ncbi:glycosyltransferase family 39 protein [Pseudomonadota bacterium]
MTVIELSKLKGPIFQVAMYLAFCIIAWASFVAMHYKVGDNFHPLEVIAQRDGSILTDSISITQYSPFNTSYELKSDVHGHWVAPDGGRRPISSLKVKIPAAWDISTVSFSYYVGAINRLVYRQFEAVSTVIEAETNDFQLVSLDLPRSGSKIFPIYSSAVNWKGDIYLLLWSLVSALMCLMLAISIAWVVRIPVRTNGHQLRRDGFQKCGLLLFSKLRVNKKLFIFGVVIFAFLLRVTLLNWGLQDVPPYSSLNVDEHFNVNVITYFPVLSPTYYGTTLSNAIALLFRIPLSMVDSIFSVSLQNYYVHSLIFRMINVILGSMVVWYVMVCTYTLTDMRTGILAGILIAVAPIHVLNSAIAHVDIFMSLLLLVTTLITIKYWRSPRFSLKTYQALGVIAGMMLGSKVTAIIFIVLSLPTLVLIEINRIGIQALFRNRELASGLMWYAILLIASYAALNWNTLINPGNEVEWIMTSVGSVSPSGRQLNYHNISFINWLSMQFEAFGAVGYAVSVLFFASPFVLKGSMRLISAWLVAIVGLYIFTFYLKEWPLLPRYMIVTAPIMCVIAACVVHRFIGSKIRWHRLFGIGIFCIVFSFSGYLALSNVLARLSDSREKVTELLQSDFLDRGPVSMRAGFPKHGYTYPFVDTSLVALVHKWEEANIVVISSRDVKEALRIMEHSDSGFETDNFASLDKFQVSFKDDYLSFVRTAMVNEDSDWILRAHIDPGRWVAMDFNAPGFYIFERK